jgi:enoyl-CoA hydratase/carnithine racemase
MSDPTASATAELVTLDLDEPGGFATVTLNNPGKRNALSHVMMKALIAALHEAGDSSARGIILAANGPVFSAGHDFADMAGQDLGYLRKLLQTCTELMTLVQQVPQPVVAKVHALATAAGCQLVASCDLAVAADTAGFALPGGKGGLFCTTPLVAVARNIGRKRALELSMTGDPIDAATAAEWGLINYAVEAAELDTFTYEFLKRCTRGSAFAKSIGKAAFYAQVDLDQPKAYSYAIEVMAANAVTADGQEGIASFLEKRKPNWQTK